jgi:hypothetical protein
VNGPKLKRLRADVTGVRPFLKPMELGIVLVCRADHRAKMTFRKLPPRYNAVLLPLFLSGLMSGIVSGISTAKMFGFQSGLGWAWFSAWLPSWLAAFLLLFVMMPLARRMVALLVEPPPKAGQ